MSHIVTVSAGSRAGSATERLADELQDRLSTAENAASSRVSLHTWGPQIADGLVTCRQHPDLAPVTEMLAAADGLVVVTPVHHASYSALFKAFFDQIPRGALAGIPTLMAASGGSQRDALVLDVALRPYLSALRALVVPTGVVVTPDDRTADGDFIPGVGSRLDLACTELTALLGHRTSPDARIHAA